MRTTIIIVLCVFLFSCDESIIIRRTVTKDIQLVFNVNQVGTSNPHRDISTDRITSFFSENDAKFYNSEIEKLDIQSLSLGAGVQQGNSARSVILSATMYGVNEGNETPILNETSNIQIISSGGEDLLSVLGNVTGVDKTNITMHNAISIANAQGLKALQTTLEKNIIGGTTKRIDVWMRATVPPGQRLVMTIVFNIKATITYKRCELIGVPLGGDECEAVKGI